MESKIGVRSLPLWIAGWVLLSALGACGNDAPPMAAALKQRDSLPVMVTYGVSKLISDSGVIRYKVVAEEWQVYDRTNPPRQTFLKGLFLEKFDEKFHVELHITADTAYCYNQNLWELRGRVFMKNVRGTAFSTEKLYWDMNRHLFYSDRYTRISTPEEELEGSSFRSNEQMTEYSIINARGYRPFKEEQSVPPEAVVDTTSLKPPK